MTQGDPIFPKLSTAIIQVFKNAQQKEKGINIDRDKLSELNRQRERERGGEGGEGGRQREREGGGGGILRNNK